VCGREKEKESSAMAEYMSECVLYVCVRERERESDGFVMDRHVFDVALCVRVCVLEREIERVLLWLSMCPRVRCVYERERKKKQK